MTDNVFESTKGTKGFSVVDIPVENVNTRLKRFVDNVDEFNDILQRTQAIVSGSTMLGALMDEKYETDLDVIIKFDQVYIMRNFLSSQGYRLSNYQGGKNKTNGSWIYIALHKRKIENQRIESLKIDLCIVVDRAPVDHVALYDFSCVMNYWDGRKFHSAFPELTKNRFSFYRQSRQTDYGIVYYDSATVEKPYNTIRMDKYKARRFTVEVLESDGTGKPFLGMLIEDEKRVTVKSYEDYKKEMKLMMDNTVNELVEAFAKMTADLDVEITTELNHPMKSKWLKIVEKRLVEAIGWPRESVSFKWSENYDQVTMDVNNSVLSI